MPNEETRRPEDWYQPGYTEDRKASSWYSDSSEQVTPWPTDAGCSTQNPPPRSVDDQEKLKKKRRRTKVISISVCLLVLLAAIGAAIMALVQGQGFRVRVTTITTANADTSAQSDLATPDPDNTGDSGDASDGYADFRDYFESYYTTSDSVDIPQGPLGTGVTVTLAPAIGEELSLQEIYEEVSPAVVGITAYQNGEKYSWGTGVVFTSSGYIITNTHIIEGCDAVTVTFSDGTERTALLIGADTTSDIAVLYLEGTGYAYAVFGDSDELRVGDTAIAIGNPLGEAYAGTMTNGIISAINRNVTYNGHNMTLLQTNAALNEGNSGGPLVNAYGQVVGITNMKIMSSYYATVEGIGFAIPSTVVKQIADQLIANGVVSGYPTIGIVAGSVSSEAQRLYDLPEGVYVSQVSDGSDAQAKGLQVGDIILAVNGQSVTTVAEVNAIKDEFSVGDALTLTIYRDGETFDMDIVLVDKGDLG
jgi:serine protease Do